MLSPRLQAVADLILGPRHADIGSDHAQLPLSLSLSRVIAIELHAGPLERARLALAGSCVELRAGDGLAPLIAGEVDSLSICGLGALNIRDILLAGLDKLPPQLVLQPMDNAGPLRHWAREHGYHLVAEQWVEPYAVLDLRLSAGPDPAYSGLPEAAAEFYGPQLVRQPTYRAWLESQARWLRDRPELAQRLGWLESLIQL